MNVFIWHASKKFKFINEIINKNSRPKFPTDENKIPECYQELIERCWCDDPKERPTFKDIVFTLKNNEEFIIDGVDKDEFLKYVEKCKKINQKAMENRTFLNIESRPTVNLIRSARIAASKKSTRKRPD